MYPHFASYYEPVSNLSVTCQRGNTEEIMQSISRGDAPDSRTLTYACQTGNIRVVDAVISVGAKPDMETLATAVATFNLAIVARAIAQNAPCSSHVITIAQRSQNEVYISAVRALVISHLESQRANPVINYTIVREPVNGPFAPSSNPFIFTSSSPSSYPNPSNSLL